MTRFLKPRMVFPEPDFPLACMPVEARAGQGVHRHGFHELAVALTGRGRYLTESGTCDIRAGDVFLIHGNAAHDCVNVRNLTVAYIAFNPRRLQLPLAELRAIPGFRMLFDGEPNPRGRRRFRTGLHLQPPDLAKARVLIVLLQEELDSRLAGYRRLARAHLVSLIGFLSRCCLQTVFPEDPLRDRLDAAFNEMDRRLADRLTLRQLAQAAHLSVRTLTRLFRRVVGRSPMEYLIHVRIERAIERLQQGFTVAETAFQCGFTDSNYFSRRFKQVTGLSPREYHAAATPLSRTTARATSRPFRPSGAERSTRL